MDIVTHIAPAETHYPTPDCACIDKIVSVNAQQASKTNKGGIFSE